MPLKTSIDEPPQMNLTSMVDVLFLLIIFFLASTQFKEYERNIDLKFPEVSNAKNLPAAPSRVPISVYRDGQITINREMVTREQLALRLAELQRANPRLSVMVRGDGAATHQSVSDVLAVCRDMGITDIGIPVRVAQGAGSSPTQQR